MTTIHDNSLSQLYRGLLQNYGSDPNYQLDADAALRMLARVGDKRGTSANVTLRKLLDAETSREDKIELVQKGMTRNEKEDLAAIIDSRELDLSPGAKSLFEDVLDRGLRAPGDLTVTPDQSRGLSGRAKAGDKIEAINLSAAPRLRLHLDDTVQIATANALGQFSGTLSGEQQIRAGDILRLRARHTDGTTTDWLTVRAQGSLLGPDTRNADVALFRVGLTTDGRGTVNVSNINEGREISEPGARLQFTNQRTGERTVVTLTDQGTFPAGFSLRGRPGDKLSVAASDGTNNTAFTRPLPSGVLEVPGASTGVDLVPDPKVAKDQQNPDGTSAFSKRKFSGPLFTQEFQVTDPQQGQLGDCYVPSAIAALGLFHADAVENAVKQNTDGSYTVTFKEYNRATRSYRDRPIRVDGDLYVRSFGGPLYGASTGDKTEARMKLLFPLIEKAYAQWKGGYEPIGQGGLSNDLFEAVLGRPGKYVPIGDNDLDRAWRAITHAIDNQLPASAGTYDDSQEWRYANSGVYSDHSYSILGYDAATRKVTLRNPWAESEPRGNGANDGIFQLDMRTFCHLFSSVMSVQD